MASEHTNTTEALDDRFATQRSVEQTLYGVADTVNGPYAAGDGGKVFARTDDGWTVVVPAGPATDRNTLLDLDVSEDRTRLWFAGASGALGMYDVETGIKYDYSAPEERTSTWEAISVSGSRGEEQLRIANGSGEVLSAELDEHGCPEFGDAEKPGAGSTITGLTFGRPLDAKEHGMDDTDATPDDPTPADPELDGDDPASTDATDEDDPHDDDNDDTDDPDDPDDETTATDESTMSDSNRQHERETAGTCFAVDTSGNVFAEGEDTWYRIGIRNAQENFHDIHAHEGELLVAGDDGMLYRYDRHCQNWTPVIVGEESLHALTSSDGEVVAAGASGTVYRRTDRFGWEPIETGLGDDLHGVAVGEHVAAVGSSGAIVDDGADRNRGGAQ